MQAAKSSWIYLSTTRIRLAQHVTLALALFASAMNSAAQTPEWSVQVAPPPLSTPLFNCPSVESAAQLSMAAESIVRNAAGDVFAISCPAEAPGGFFLTTSSAFSVARLNPATGAEVWRRDFLGTDITFYTTFRNFIALDSAGNIIAATSLFSDESGQFTYVVKYAAVTGQKLWQTFLTSPAFAIEPLPSGNVRVNQGNVSQTLDAVSGVPISNEAGAALPDRGGVPLASGGIAYVALTSVDGLVRRVAKYLNAAPPGAPTITGGFTSNDLVSLSFLSPSNNGGAPILDYKIVCVEASLNGVVVSRTVSGSPATSTISDENGYGYYPGFTLKCHLLPRNLFGYGTASDIKSFFTATAQFALIDVVSRKAHAASGNFDLPIARNIAISGPVTVEPRVAGSGHLVVFQFNDVIQGVSNLMMTIGSGPAAPATNISIYDNELRVSLPATSVPDGSRVRISGSVANSLVTIAIAESLGFLLGDAENSGTVDQTDVNALRARSGQRVSPGNFRFDINLSGAVTVADILAGRGRKGRALAN